MALVFVQIARHLYQINNFKVLNDKLVSSKYDSSLYKLEI